ncbi:RAD55 family ATPase [Candidatus Hodarchaeum mangrovi]
MVRTKGTLPTEFPDFEELDKSYSLLIKGLPGTGKSSLALDLVAHLPNSFYVSTRLNPRELLQDFPWLEETIPTERQRSFFVDATRTQSAESDSDILILKFETMPEFVQKIFSLGAKSQKKIIVIDSWNGLTINLSDSQIRHWESAIVQYLRSEESKIIFIEEGVKDSSLDWIVDGIIVLSKRTHISEHGIPRRIRELNFEKMRGREIKNETYLASLSSGRFKTFEPFKYRFPAIILKSPTLNDPGEQFISTGASSFDDLLAGGLEKGSWNLFDVSTTVGDALDIILFPMITNHLNNNRPLISIFREGVTFDSKKSFYDVFTGTENWIEHTFNFERYIPKSTPNRNELPDNLDQLLEKIQQIKQTMRKKIGTPFLINLGLDVLENKYGIRDLNRLIAILVSQAKLEGDVIVGWLKENQEYQGGTTAASTHWKIDLINRALVLEGIIPATEYFAIEPVLYKGYIDYNLIPIL